MTTQDDLEQTLWDYLYGLLEPDEARALEQRITSEHDVARAYAEARQRADMLSAAARVESAPLTFELPQEERASPIAPTGVTIRPAVPTAAHPRWQWMLASAALALVALVGYTYAVVGSRLDVRELVDAQQAVAAEYRRVIVTGPQQVQPEITNLYAVQLEDLNGVAAAAEEFAYALCDENGDVLKQQQAQTDGDGNGYVQLVGIEVPAHARLRVWAKPIEEAIVTELSLTRAEPRYETLLSFNKAAYRPGETAYFRSVTLSSLAPREEREFQIDYALKTPADTEAIPVAAGVTRYGVGNGEVQLQSSLDADRFIVLAQPGQQPPRTAQATVEALDIQNEVPQTATATGDAPAEGEPIAVRFFPEGGQLVAGLENRVVCEATDQRGQPLVIRGTVLDSAQRQVAEVTTTTNGIGEFELTPLKTESYSVSLQPSGATVARVLSLPPVAADLFARLSVPAKLPAGASLECEVATTKAPAQLLVAAYRDSAVVTQQFVDFDTASPTPATQRVRMPVADEIAGALEVVLFDAQHSPPVRIGQQSTYREPTQYLQLALEQNESDNAWKVSVRDEQGRPTSAVLGINVLTDTAPVAAQSSLATAWYDSKSQSLDESKLSEVSPEALAMDFAWGVNEMKDTLPPGEMASGRFAKDAAAAEDASRARIAAVAPPLLGDNLQQVEAAYQHAITQRHDAQQARLRTFATAICVISLLVLLVTAIAAVLRTAGQIYVWAPALGVSLGSLFVGLMWMSTEQRTEFAVGAVALQEFDGETRQVALVDEQSGVDGTFESEVSPTNGPAAPRSEAAADMPMPPVVDPSSTRDSDEPATLETNAAGLSLGAGMGGVGGGLGAAAIDSSGLSTLDRLRTKDFYSFVPEPFAIDAHYYGIGSLGRTLLNPTEYTPLPIRRFALGDMPPLPAIEPARAFDTIYWDPLVKTNDQGEAELRFQLPQHGRYRVLIDAHGNGRLGRLDKTIDRTPPAALPAPSPP